MKTLILRTFAHSKIWEGTEDYCYYEGIQKNQILEWEPDFLTFKPSDFELALGIYTEKYFTGYFEPWSAIKKIANKGTDREKIISSIELTSVNCNLFQDVKNSRIEIGMKFKNKLWVEPNKELMWRLDGEFIKQKTSELDQRKIAYTDSPYKPLAFTLEANKVTEILNKYL